VAEPGGPHGSSVAWWFATYKAEFAAAIVQFRPTWSSRENSIIAVKWRVEGSTLHSPSGYGPG